MYKNVDIYPGGKNRLLPHLRPHLGAAVGGAKEYHDIFVGGGSVLLDVAERHPTVRLFVNDADPAVAARFRVTVGPEPMFGEFLRRMPQHIAIEDVLDAHAVIDSSKEDVSLAAAGVILSRAHHSGIQKGGLRRNLNERYSKASVERAARRERQLLLGRLTVLNLDFRDYFERLGPPQADRAIYLDPPYVEKGEELYTHFFTERDHRDLAALAASHPRVVISYDDHPLILDLYAWADCHEVPVRYDGTGEVTTELLFTSPALVAVAAHANGAA